MTNPTIARGITDSFSIWPNPVNANVFNSYKKFSFLDLIHSNTGLHAYVGLKTLHYRSLNSLRHAIAFLSFSFSLLSTVINVPEPILNRERQIIAAMMILPSLIPPSRLHLRKLSSIRDIEKITINRVIS